MVEFGVKNDAEIARRSGIPQSTIHNARKGAASPSAIGALKAVFPNASLDDLIVVPASPEVPGVLAS
ncbi:hypothetical protein A9Z40_02955 [Microbacterium arborescens]|uniref:HTH cro/C1-type domain-containing protein n=2 Tax=Microbacterium arborescens TaxID=33883 RepID=A0ABX2WI79_9MICO|nr:hypothetical protein A9Z40_02955 [Microbacterium arborescens]